MLKEHVSIFRKTLVFIDILCISGAFFLGYFGRNYLAAIYPLQFYLWILPVLLTIWIVLFHFFGMYASFRLKSPLTILAILAKTSLLTFMIFSALMYILKVPEISRSFIGFIFIAATFFLTCEKMFIMLFFKNLRKRDFNFRNILVVGSGKRIQRFLHRVNATPEFGLKVVGVVDNDEAKVGQTIEGHKVIGILKDWKHIICTRAVDHVFFIVPLSWLDKIDQHILYCEILGIPASVAMDFYHLQFTRGKESEELGFPLITFDPTMGKVGSLMVKRVFDFSVALTALIFLSPLFATIMLMIKLTSSGPLFFKQERCTLNGRRFYIYKFRTMVADAEKKLQELLAHNEMTGPAFKMKNDPRLTPIGGFLRKFSLDELPQFWNVLKGNMSIVGPRPPLPQEVEQYRTWQRRKLSMRAGLTCLWQISGRSEITDFDEWMRLDLKYIDEWSLKLDFEIFLKTIPAVLFVKGAK